MAESSNSFNDAILVVSWEQICGQASVFVDEAGFSPFLWVKSHKEMAWESKGKRTQSLKSIDEIKSILFGVYGNELKNEESRDCKIFKSNFDFIAVPTRMSFSCFQNIVFRNRVIPRNTTSFCIIMNKNSSIPQNTIRISPGRRRKIHRLINGLNKAPCIKTENSETLRTPPLRNFLADNSEKKDDVKPLSEFIQKYVVKNSALSRMVVSDSRLKQFKMRRKPNALIDTMERVLPCPYCPKMFKRNAHVASHIRTHMLKKKMFKCSFCDATFSFMSGKRRHEKTHTGESIVHCEVCGKKFFRTHRLNIHRLKMHPEAIL